MPDFPRTVIPRSATHPIQPPGLSSWGASGKGQFRDIIHVGAQWTETYPPLRASDTTVRAFITQVNELWRNRTVFDINHLKLTLMGGGGGTPLVNGATQTGSSIATDGWTASANGVLRAGDIIKFAGVNTVYFVTADVNSNASGQATILINPKIYSGGSPANNAIITINNVKFRAVIVNLPELPKAMPGDVYGEFEITFREAP